MAIKPENINVLVIGDLMLDRYIIGDASRISPEAPVPVVRQEEIKDILGGAANVAKNIAELGAKPVLIGAVGNDNDGAIFRKLAQKSGINVDSVLSDSSRPTTIKSRIVTQSYQQLLRVDNESTDTISPALENKIISAIKEKSAGASIIIISDYAKGLVTSRIVEAAKESAKKGNKLVLVDPKPVHTSFYNGVSIITPNLKESREMAHMHESAPGEVGKKLADQLNCKVLMTLGSDGMMLIYKGGSVKIDVDAKEVFDVTGAGDTVIATFAVALASGMNDIDSARLSNKAAGIIVGKRRVHGIDLRKELGV